MGLDMYLQARRRTPTGPEPESYDAWKQWREGNVHELAYWRKDNAIHRWFVEHLGGGVDECQPMPVDLEQLLGLRSACEEVLADPRLAEGRLPTTAGFFFGGTDYDEWYFNGLRDTIKQIDDAVAFFGDPVHVTDFELVYQASW